jgi:hypothetical protein
MSKEKIEMIKEQWQESNSKFYKRNGNKNQEMMKFGQREVLIDRDLQSIKVILYRMD